MKKYLKSNMAVKIMKMIDVIVGMAVMLTIGDKMDEEKGREGVRII